ncbi:hypothetical protein CCHR01_15950 [Colletotrichum chrysophilum]|uniref:Uncharacterized protein n=1 Tax=Colletotrichum chrysophilum TaxID=1836956 RepID=A0AAD9A4U5_9PEZI|nr:hypothetical protein CCHR01_15950 [Colletotrichum chrysophilum]
MPAGALAECSWNLEGRNNVDAHRPLCAFRIDVFDDWMVAAARTCGFASQRSLSPASPRLMSPRLWT